MNYAEENMMARLGDSETGSKEAAIRALTRETRRKRMHCNSCVEQVVIQPAVDGNRCPGCGWTLSEFGPFQEAPTLFPTPKPLPRVWWIGDRPAAA